jgi:hypothetical protein
LLVVLYGFIK